MGVKMSLGGRGEGGVIKTPYFFENI